MIEDLLEFNNDDGVKESKLKHPTLKQVQKKMRGFDESLIMYVYHQLNGREQEAQSYLAEWNEEQDELHQAFLKQNELNQQQEQLQLTEHDENENKIIST